MYIWSAIFRLLAVLAVAGLVTGPLAAPAQARAPSEMSAAMPDGMSCCDPAPAEPDCDGMKGCPFAALCLAKVLPGLTSGVFAATRLPAAVRMPFRDDRRRDGLVRRPPGHPPKSIS